MILGCLLFPSAKLALADHARGTLLAVACGLEQAPEDFDEDDLYAAMDPLTGRWANLEKELYPDLRPFCPFSVFYPVPRWFREKGG
jgi:hypothetical protein